MSPKISEKISFLAKMFIWCAHVFNLIFHVVNSLLGKKHDLLCYVANVGVLISHMIHKNCSN